VPDGGDSAFGCQLLLFEKTTIYYRCDCGSPELREVRIAAQKAQNKSMSEKVFAQTLSEVSGFAETANDLATLQNFIVEIIPERLPYYNWTGFYMLDPMIRRRSFSARSVECRLSMFASP
jgi:hypothetical protein